MEKKYGEQEGDMFLISLVGSVLFTWFIPVYYVCSAKKQIKIWVCSILFLAGIDLQPGFSLLQPDLEFQIAISQGFTF